MITPAHRTSIFGTTLETSTNGDKKLIEDLEEYISQRNEWGVDVCLKKLLDFSKLDLTQGFDRFFHLHKEFKWSTTETYRKNLTDAFYAFICTKECTPKIIQDCLENQNCFHREHYGNLLLSIFFENNMQDLCIGMISVMNHFELSSHRKNTFSYLSLLFKFVEQNNKEEVINCLNMIYRERIKVRYEQTFTSSPIDALRYLDRVDYPELVANLLQAAKLGEHALLFRDCIDSLFLSVHTLICSPVPGKKIYEKGCKVGVIAGLDSWAASLILEEYSKPKDWRVFQKIQPLLSFICHYPYNKSAVDFIKVIEEAAKNFSTDERREFVHYLLRVAISFQEPLSISYVFGLLEHFQLHRHPHTHKEMISLLIQICNCDHAIPVYISTLSKFPPLLTLLDNYIQNLPSEKYSDLFQLLDIGMKRVPDVNFSHFCLHGIEKYNLYDHFPVWSDYSKLLQFSEPANIIPYCNNITLFQVGPQVFTLPRAIVCARAPNFERAVKEASLSSEDIVSMIRFLANQGPDPYLSLTENKSLEGLLKLYQFAVTASLFDFVRQTHEHLTKEYYRKTDIPLLLEFFKLSFGHFQLEIRDILFGLLLNSYLLKEIEISDVIITLNKMREHTPGIFKEISLAPILNRMFIPVILSEDFALLFHVLIPEVEYLDLKICPIEKGFIKGISGRPFARPISLAISYTRVRDYFDEILEVNLLTLKLYHANLDALKICAASNVKELFLNEFYLDKYELKKWLEKCSEQTFFPQLRSLDFKIHYRDNSLNEDSLSLLLPQLKELNHIGLNGCFIDDGLLRKIISLFSQLQSFSSQFHFSEERKNLSLQNLNFFLKSYSELTKLSLKLYSLIIENPSSKIETNGNLQSLTLFAENEIVLKLLQDNPNLEYLNLKSNPLTPAVLSSISKLKKLTTLNIASTKIVGKEILRLAAALPRLTKLTIQCSDDYQGYDAERMVVNRLALRKIDVKVIAHKK